MKKITAIVLILLLTLCGCDASQITDKENVLGAYADKEEDEKYNSLTSITMLYYPDMDTNPATTSCLANHELLKYVYSPLISVNDSFDPTCVLAESFSRSGGTVTVKLKENIFFSNGEPVTAADVVASYNAIKNQPTSPYYNSLTQMYKYYAQDNKTFVCQFDFHDVDCVLTLDIPIMYKGKAGIGCGPYVFSEQNGKPVLIPNVNYFEKPSVPLIKLVETKNDDYIDDMFSSGALDVMISSAVDGLSLTSLRDYKIVSMPSNRFVYIGINFNKPEFVSVDVRKSISDIIDKENIAKKSLVDLASATDYPFNPSWSKMKSAGADSVKRASDGEIVTAVQILKDIPLTLTVPENSYKITIANALVEQFRAVGITLNIRVLDSMGFTNAVTTGDFELYLGEIAVPHNMDPTALYRINGSVNYGGYADYEFDLAYDKYKTGSIELKSYLEAFSSRLPVIPLLFGKSVIYCADGIEKFSGPAPYSVYGNGAGLKLR